MSSSGEDYVSEDSDLVKRRIANYFGDGTEYQLDRFLSNGIAAHAWLVRYRRQDQDPWRKMVLKTPAYVEGPLRQEQFANGPEGVEEFYEESMLLKTLRARHLVRLIEFGDQDPLERNGARNYFGNWIYLEFLENGTLAQFVEKYKAQDIPYVPNRLLWRIFMCMIRACIAMAYIPPGDAVDRYDENEEPCLGSKGSYTHVDMHSKNVMIGAILGDPDDPEHDISPVVKFIDLDHHELYDGGEGEGARQNVFLVGANMAEVILGLENQCLDISEAEEEKKPPVPCQLPWRPAFNTFAKDMLPGGQAGDRMPHPELDPYLRYLICLCCAAQEEERPRLADQLLPWVTQAIRERDAAYYDGMDYCDGEEETDDCVLLFLEKVLGAAPPPQEEVDAGEAEEEQGGGGGGGPESMEIVYDSSGYGTSRSSRGTSRDGRETSPQLLVMDLHERFRQREPLADRDDDMDLS
ncbi:hypothetical protein PG996_006356 [Apiospora saccharicola]|uniref:Protein kinase domain-containing protein n=1 Tax=Apiospora saccharicola TaxID=335842 RepID=A0ABR1VT51_9PEZI